MRAVQRDLPFYLDDTKSLHPCNLGDRQQLLETGEMTSHQPLINAWARDGLLAGEEDQAKYYCGCYWIYGSIRKNKKKILAPILISEISINTDETNHARVAVDWSTLSLYEPLLAHLLSEESTDPDDLQRLIEQFTRDLPSDIEDRSSIRRLVEAINARMPASNGAIAISDLKLADTLLAELKNPENTEGLQCKPCMIIIRQANPPDFSVERELSKIIDDTALTSTAVARIDPTEQLTRTVLDFTERETPVTRPSATLKVLNVLSLSDVQSSAILSALENDLTVISGPPGTGKSHSISALTINLAFHGKSVLVTSKTKEAVSVVVEKLTALGGKYAVAHVGDRHEQREFGDLLKGLIDHENLTPAFLSTDKQTEKSLLERLQKEREQLETEIRKQEALHAQFHVSKAELSKLPDVPLPTTLPSAMESQALRDNMEWVDILFSSPSPPPFHLKLRSRSLLNRTANRLAVEPRSLDRKEAHLRTKVLFHRAKATEVQEKLSKRKSIRELWDQLGRVVFQEQVVSRKLYETSRRHALSELLFGNDKAKPALQKYIQSLKSEGKKKASARRKRSLLDNIDPAFLLRCFPIWACTTTNLSETVRLHPGLFDYVIIDEASLCDPATAIPALFRAKHAVIVGDERQLKHRPRVTPTTSAQMAQKNKIPAEVESSAGYARSLFELANARVSKRASYMLDEHYRSLPPIIAYSNREFYGGHLRIMRRNPSNETAACIEFVHSHGMRNDQDVIPEEYEAASRIVRSLGNDTSKIDVGVIAMTIKQAEYLRFRFKEDFSDKDITRLRLKVGNPEAFQGDQRHTIILCIGLGPDAHQTSIKHAFDSNRFNVAITRATDCMHIVSAMPPSKYPDHMQRYHELATSGHFDEETRDEEERLESGFERDVYRLLRNKGYRILTQYDSCGYRIDMVVHRGGAFVAIEVDGPHHFQPGTHEYVSEDIVRELRLRRAGWPIERISCFEWDSNPDAGEDLIRRIEASLSKDMPTTRTEQKRNENGPIASVSLAKTVDEPGYGKGIPAESQLHPSGVKTFVVYDKQIPNSSSATPDIPRIADVSGVDSDKRTQCNATDYEAAIVATLKTRGPIEKKHLVQNILTLLGLTIADTDDVDGIEHCLLDLIKTGTISLNPGRVYSFPDGVGRSSKSDATQPELPGTLSPEDERAIKEIAEVPADRWMKIAKWAKEHDKLQPWQRSLAFSLGRIAQTGKTPSIKQARQGKRILGEVEKLGG